jgi:hypothetical protein
MVDAADVKKSLAASQLTALIHTYETAVPETVCFKEFIDNVQWWGLTVSKEDSNITRGLVHNQQVRSEPIMGVDHSITAFCWLCEVQRQGPEEAKVHVKTLFAFQGLNR